jgi:hypothetical protein
MLHSASKRLSCDSLCESAPEIRIAVLAGQFKSELHHYLTDPKIPHVESDNPTPSSVAG